MANKKESKFQKELIDEIKSEFPGSMVLKNDPNYIQGIPDLTILWEDKWAVLEVKKSLTASHQPNQDYYISKLRDMSFAEVVYPENKEEIMNELQRSLRAGR